MCAPDEYDEIEILKFDNDSKTIRFGIDIIFQILRCFFGHLCIDLDAVNFKYTNRIILLFLVDFPKQIFEKSRHKASQF